jgi:DNA/RNA endonuclease YhcR with UshA esterase domain
MLGSRGKNYCQEGNMTKKNSLIFSVLVFLLAITFPAYSSDIISPEEAIKHIGEQCTVCGHVASSHFAYRSKGQPTFLNLSRPYPNQIFTVLIWGSDRKNFSNSPEDYYKNQRICVTGTIQQYKGTPEIIVKNPAQIKIQ